MLKPVTSVTHVTLMLIPSGQQRVCFRRESRVQLRQKGVNAVSAVPKTSESSPSTAACGPPPQTLHTALAVYLPGYRPEHDPTFQFLVAGLPERQAAYAAVSILANGNGTEALARVAPHLTRNSARAIATGKPGRYEQNPRVVALRGYLRLLKRAKAYGQGPVTYEEIVRQFECYFRTTRTCMCSSRSRKRRSS